MHSAPALLVLILLTLVYCQKFGLFPGEGCHNFRKPVDKTNSNLASTRTLKNLISEYALLDTWHTHNPQLRDYTFFSRRLDSNLIKVASYNVNGVLNPIKRSKIISKMKKEGVG